MRGAGRTNNTTTCKCERTGSCLENNDISASRRSRAIYGADTLWRWGGWGIVMV